MGGFWPEGSPYFGPSWFASGVGPEQSVTKMVNKQLKLLQTDDHWASKTPATKLKSKRMLTGVYRDLDEG